MRGKRNKRDGLKGNLHIDEVIKYDEVEMCAAPRGRAGIAHRGEGTTVTATPDMICLSPNHWTGLTTSKKHLMQIFSRKGRVLFVEPPIDLLSVLGRRRR
ncbi:MAG: hypothetical protein U9Q95_05750, partial [Candidatus Eisenbacteria bacterium]|nr:hypothetical protein [Candidatus Eisenbacteria bacterium]